MPIARIPIRPALLVPLTLPACIPSIVVGDTPQDGTDGSTTQLSGSTASTGSDVPTTTDAPPVPGECGDGVLNLGEACDDGNTEANDGCDLACQPSGRVVWTVEPSGFSAWDLAIDPAGRIIVSGWDNGGAILLGLTPDGTELWRKPTPDAGELAIDPAGRIFVGSPTGSVFALTANHQLLWDFAPDLPEGVFEGVIGLDVTADAAYVGVSDSENHFLMRRFDLTTGAVVWETVSPAFATLAADLAVVGDRVFVVGQTHDEESEYRPMLAEFDTGGALLSLEPEDPVVRRWASIAAVGDGDLVMAASGADPGILLRRLGPDGAERWTTLAEIPNWLDRVVTGADDRIAVLGDVSGAPGDAAGHVQLYDAAGALLWSSTIDSPLDEQGANLAGSFGPNALVVACWTWSGGSSHTSIRRFALD